MKKSELINRFDGSEDEDATGYFVQFDGRKMSLEEYAKWKKDHYMVADVNKYIEAVKTEKKKELVGKDERKSSGIFGVMSKLLFKKKSRADIVKLVANGDLVPAQLIQIKNAIERGLTEGQLVELINNNLSPDKMKEIIEIAVLENSILC